MRGKTAGQLGQIVGVTNIRRSDDKSVTCSPKCDQSEVRDSQATKTINADGHISQSLYDADGNLTATVDGYGFTTSMLYDADGQLTETINPLRATTVRLD